MLPQFDLLGSGQHRFGSQLPWHTDFKTGRQWPLAYCADIEYNELDRPTDVKVPWELSRCQHFIRLGQAYWLTGDERYAAEFVDETNDWIATNPLSRGVNWACAMDVALRAVSWIWGFHFFAHSQACRDRLFRSRFLRTLFLHGEFVVKHLEKADLNGNHYVCDGVGLVFLGCFFRRSRSAAGWRTLGRSIVEHEIFEQTTPDGVDFEQATAYHRLVLEAFLMSYELLRRHGEQVPGRCWQRLERMCEFVQVHEASRSLPAHRRCRRWARSDSGNTADPRPPVPASHAAALFRRGDFRSSAGRCWEETFWLLGPSAPAGFRQLPAHRRRHPQRFRTAGFTCCAGPRPTSSWTVRSGMRGREATGTTIS